MTTVNTSTPRTAADPMALVDVDHVRFFVGNAKQAAFFYAYNFGFTIAQRADLTTGSRDRSRYLLTQGNIRLLLETPLSKDDPAAEELRTMATGSRTSPLLWMMPRRPGSRPSRTVARVLMNHARCLMSTAA